MSPAMLENNRCTMMPRLVAVMFAIAAAAANVSIAAPPNVVVRWERIVGLNDEGISLALFESEGNSLSYLRTVRPKDRIVTLTDLSPGRYCLKTPDEEIANRGVTIDASFEVTAATGSALAVRAAVTPVDLITIDVGVNSDLHGDAPRSLGEVYYWRDGMPFRLAGTEPPKNGTATLRINPDWQYRLKLRLPDRGYVGDELGPIGGKQLASQPVKLSAHRRGTINVRWSAPDDKPIADAFPNHLVVVEMTTKSNEGWKLLRKKLHQTNRVPRCQFYVPTDVDGVIAIQGVVIDRKSKLEMVRSNRSLVDPSKKDWPAKVALVFDPDKVIKLAVQIESEKDADPGPSEIWVHDRHSRVLWHGKSNDSGHAEISLGQAWVVSVTARLPSGREITRQVDLGESQSITLRAADQSTLKGVCRTVTQRVKGRNSLTLVKKWDFESRLTIPTDDRGRFEQTLDLQDYPVLLIADDGAGLTSALVARPTDDTVELESLGKRSALSVTIPKDRWPRFDASAIVMVFSVDVAPKLVDVVRVQTTASGMDARDSTISLDLPNEMLKASSKWCLVCVVSADDITDTDHPTQYSTLQFFQVDEGKVLEMKDDRAGRWLPDWGQIMKSVVQQNVPSESQRSPGG